MNRIERMTGIVLLLQERAATAERIAAHFEVSRRTILRDVQALCEIGVPVVAQPGAGGGYSLPPTYRLPALPLTTPEAFLLLLALDALRRLADTPYAAERATLAAKLRSLLTPDQLAPVDRLLSLVALDTPERAQRAPLLDPLLAAARDGCWVLVTYQSAKRESRQHLWPRAIVAQRGHWYCHAYAYEHDAERSYRVDRMRALEPAGPEFDSRLPPSARAYDDPAHPEVRATLTAQGVALAETEPNLGNAILLSADGTGRLAFRCPPSELDWYARYFAGLGADVEVAAPPALRERMRQLGAELAARYADDRAL
jgi:predicted DNA-binding transcriptional regulator YafY